MQIYDFIIAFIQEAQRVIEQTTALPLLMKDNYDYLGDSEWSNCSF